MSADALSDVLRAVRLRGAIFFYLEGTEPWVAETPHAQEIQPAILPGVDHMLEFHVVARGSCWAGLPGEAPVRLDEGDVVMFPQGDHHVVSSAPGLRGTVDRSFFFAPKPPQLPFSISLSKEGAATARLDGGGDRTTTVVCGFLGFDARPFNPLLASMPRVLRLPGLARDGQSEGRTDGQSNGQSRGQSRGQSWIGGFIRSAVEESNRKQPGGEAVLERMSEMLFVEALRHYAATLGPDEVGWLGGMRDPAVGRALGLIHQQPAEPWTLERLAEAVALSRSTFHERFVHFLGQPPMQYLTRWRMQLAAGWLRDTDAKVIEIALQVGYENETAFSRAFRRAVGESPAAWRRARRRPPQPSAAPRT